MQRVQSRLNSRHSSWLYLFLGGFLIGTFIMNVWKNIFLSDDGLLNATVLNRLKYLEVDGDILFGYVLKERIGMAVLLCLLATTCLGLFVISAYLTIMGAMAGMFLSAAAIRYGLKGIFLMIVAVLPQYLFLVPAFIMLLNWCCRICMILYFPHRAAENTDIVSGQLKMKRAVQLCIILGVVIIGCVIESYVNPIFLTNFLKIF